MTRANGRVIHCTRRLAFWRNATLENHLQPARFEAARAQDGDGLVGEDAECAAAVGDDLLRRIELGEPRFERAERDVQSAGQMSQSEFIFGPSVENDDCSRAQPLRQFLAEMGSRPSRSPK